MSNLKLNFKEVVKIADIYQVPEDVIITINSITYTRVTHVPGDSYITAFPVLDGFVCAAVRIDIDAEVVKMLEPYKSGVKYVIKRDANIELKPDSEVSFWRVWDRNYFFFRATQEFVEFDERLYNGEYRRHWEVISKSVQDLILTICEDTGSFDHMLEEFPITDSVNYFKRDIYAIDEPYMFRDYLSPLAYDKVFPYPMNTDIGLKPIKEDIIYNDNNVPIKFEVYKKNASGDYEETGFTKTLHLSWLKNMFGGFWETVASEYNIDLEHFVPIFMDVPEVDLYNPYLYLGDIPNAPYNWVFLGDGSVISDHDNPEDLCLAEINIWKSRLI